MGNEPRPATLDPMAPATIECPYPFYRYLHAEAPIFKAPQGFYIVSRYEDVVEVLRKPELFSSDFWHLMDPGPAGAKVLADGYPRVNTMLTRDPPGHRRYRKLVEMAFSPARVKRMEDYIEQIIAELIDTFIADGEVELVRQFAIPLPIFVIADQLGVPREDMDRFKLWSDSIASQFAQTASEAEEIENAHHILDFQRYFTDRCAEKRANPGDDVISSLVTLELADEDAPGGTRPLNGAELNSVIEQLLVAGNETTTNTITKAMLMLVQNPPVLATLREDPDRIRAYVEEVLRIEAPVQGHPRIVRQDTVLAGVELKAGDILNLRFGAANRDAGQFPEPDRIDLCRGNGMQHLAFSQGIHFCLGAALARKEIELALRALTVRLGDFGLAPGRNDLTHISSFAHRGLKALWLTFDGR